MAARELAIPPQFDPDQLDVSVDEVRRRFAEIRSGEWEQRCARIIEHAKTAGTPPERLGYTAYVDFDDEREERHKQRIQQVCKRLGYNVQVTTEHVSGPNGEEGIKFTPTRRRDVELAPTRDRVSTVTVAFVRRISATPRPRATRSRVGQRSRSPGRPGSEDPHRKPVALPEPAR